MQSRPLSVSVAAILQVIVNVFNFPGPWWDMFPGTEEAPAFALYGGIVLGIVSLVAAVGLWMLKKWGFWLTVVATVLNILLGLPGIVMAPGVALDVAIAVQVIGFVVVLVLVVLPTSRRAFAAT
jgi:uncharacterized membrane protein (DUF2068 family)